MLGTWAENYSLGWTLKIILKYIFNWHAEKYDLTHTKTQNSDEFVSVS